MTKILKTKALVDPALSEFVYTVAVTTPVSMKRRLPLKYYKAILTERSAKSFSVKSTLHQKKEFLEHLGFRSFLILSNSDNVWDTRYKEILKQFEKNSKGKTLEEISEHGLYVTSDKELIHLLTQVSHAVSTDLYRMEQEIYRAKNKQVNWSTKLDSDELKEIRKEEEESKLIVKLMISAITDFVNCDKFLDVAAQQAGVLMWLYLSPNSYIKHDELITKFKNIIPANKMKGIERNLLELVMIQPHVDYREKSFTITSRGIRTVHQFRDRVLKSFNF